MLKMMVMMWKVNMLAIPSAKQRIMDRIPSLGRCYVSSVTRVFCADGGTYSRVCSAFASFHRNVELDDECIVVRGLGAE
jgi:hypothetical protein